MVMLKKEMEMDGGFGYVPRRAVTPPEPAPAPVPEALVDAAWLRHSTDPARWKEAVAVINASVKKIDMQAAYAVSSAPDQDKMMQEKQAAALAPLAELMRSIGRMEWPSKRAIYTYGHMDVNVVALSCEKKLIDWQTAFNGKAAFGTPEELQILADKAKLAGVTLQINYALPWAAKPQLLVTGLWHNGNLETTEKLFTMNADPAYDNNGALFVAVVEQGRKDIGKVFARHGQQGLLDVNNWAQWALRNRKPQLHADLREIAFEYGNFHMVDDTSIQQTKPLADGGGTLKILFNFAAARVYEIMETQNPRQAIVKDFSFAEYGENALVAARAKLIEMNGHPPEIDNSFSSKPLMPKPAGLTRKS